ncbi:MAG: NF038122 family metalloprotease, partial [Planctomycetota bacterium]
MARRLLAGCYAVAMLACAILVITSQPSAAQPEDAGSRGDVPGTHSAHMIYRQPGPVLNSTLYADGASVQFDTVIETRPICGSDCSAITLDDLREVAASHRRYFDDPDDGSQDGGPRDGGEPRSGLDIVFNVSGDPPGAQAAIDAVEAYIESVFSDPITVTINLSFSDLPSGVLGWTSVSYAGNISWPIARTGLINGMDVSDYIQDYLPLVSGTYIPVRYNGGSSSVTNENSVYVARANYNATIGTSSGTAASMEINTDFSWDYTPPSISGYCFQSVLAHEVGHALGFVSAADSTSGGYMELMDIYRFQRTDGSGDYNPDSVAEFETTARLVDYNTPNDDHNTVLYEWGGVEVEYRMADGDPDQASHFRQGVYAIMQPAMGYGTTFYPDFYKTPDIAVFDAIGWDDTGHLPDNNECSSATEVGNGTFGGTTAFATNNGSASCGLSNSSPDVWYTWTSGPSGTLIAETCASAYDTVIS